MTNQHIPMTADALPFTPKSLPEEKAGAVFLMQPMTEADLDRLGYELFRHAITPPTQEGFRATVIDEIFNIFPADEAEEKAQLLDMHWQSEDAYQDQLADWKAQDRQRRFDIANGAGDVPAQSMPVRSMGLRDRTKATMLAEELNRSSARLRNMTVDMQTYGARQRAGMARLSVLGWRGLKTPYERVDGIVPAETWDALFAEVGKATLTEIENYVLSLGSIGEDERGNSELPPGTDQAPDTSPQPNGASESSDGSSTSGEMTSGTAPSSSNSEPTRGSASDRSTGESSISSSASHGEIPTQGGIPAEPTKEPQLP